MGLRNTVTGQMYLQKSLLSLKRYARPMPAAYYSGLPMVNAESTMRSI